MFWSLNTVKLDLTWSIYRLNLRLRHTYLATQRDQMLHDLRICCNNYVVEDVSLAARSAEDRLQSGSANVQSLQHVHAGVPSSPNPGSITRP